MPNLNQAREWAEEGKDIYRPGSRIKAVIDIILSLPDQWVDAEKVAELADDMANWCLPDEPSTTEIDYRRLVEIMDGFTGRINDLLAPPLPTLDELTRGLDEDIEQYRWMQARLEGSAFDFVISDPGLVESMLWAKGGTAHIADNSLITPLPGPKLEWPGSGDEPTIAQKEKVAADQAVTKDVCNSESNSSETPKSSIKPEDVPANEPWLIEVADEKYVGTRYEHSTAMPWAVASLSGLLSGDYSDNEITLIHKLVPEPPALPEGMRLADHKECGRVVVSQRADKDGNYKVFCSISSTVTGDDWWCAHKNELTFLDGNQ